MIGRFRPQLARLIGDTRAATLTEFAITAPVFLMTMMAIFDFSMMLYAKSVLQGAVNRAARDAALEGNNSTQTAIDAAVTTQVRAVFQDGTLTYSRRAYDSFDDVGKPEPLTDSNNNGVRDAGECFTDSNGNSSWDTLRGNSGQGGGDEVVLYTATMNLSRIFPGWKMLGQPQNSTLTASTVLRNQPFNTNTRTSNVICT
jgi:Flp pilus assembly protein TadG